MPLKKKKKTYELRSRSGRDKTRLEETSRLAFLKDINKIFPYPILRPTILSKYNFCSKANLETGRK